MSHKSAGDIREKLDSIRGRPRLKTFKKWRMIGEAVVADLKANGRFFKTRHGLLVFDQRCKRTFELNENDEFTAVVNSRYGINAREHIFARVLADLRAEAQLHGEKVDVRRFAHYDSMKKCLYVSRFDGSLYKLDGKSIESVPNGTDSAFFVDDSANWEPFTYIPGCVGGKFDDVLINSVNFTAETLSVEEQKKLLKLWILGVFFGSLQPTKIVLLLLGEHGSGKTSALRLIQKLLFGPRLDLLSIEKDKPDGFVATITKDTIALFDNLDDEIPWLPSALSRLATGISFTRRELFTTNTKAEYSGVSWVGITARSVRFMKGQEDLPDRTLILRLNRLDHMLPEGELLTTVQTQRNALWSELLDDLNRAVSQLQAAPALPSMRFRMADFASFCVSIAPSLGWDGEVEHVFEKLERAQSELIGGGDPIPQVLSIWLRQDSNQGRMADAGTLEHEWRRIANELHIPWPFKSGKSLGQRLSRLGSALRPNIEMTVAEDLHAKQNVYTFTLRESRALPTPTKRNFSHLIPKRFTLLLPALPADREA